MKIKFNNENNLISKVKELELKKFVIEKNILLAKRKVKVFYNSDLNTFLSCCDELESYKRDAIQTDLDIFALETEMGMGSIMAPAC